MRVEGNMLGAINNKLDAGFSREADPAVVWTNFAGNLEASPAAYFVPRSISELQEFVHLNRSATIRAVGSGHSWSPLASTDCIMVDMRKIVEDGKKAWRFSQDGWNLVTVLPSATVADVEAACQEADPHVPPFAFPTTSVSRSINMIGFIATGSHGTGWEQPTVSDLIYRIELMSADGEIHVFSEKTTPEDMPALRVSLGMLGLITKVTFKVDQMFNLLNQELILKLSEVLGPNPQDHSGRTDASRLLDLVTRNEYLELFWVPGSGLNPADGYTTLGEGSFRVKQWNRTREPVRDVPARSPEWQSILAIAVMDEAARHAPDDCRVDHTTLFTQRGVWEGFESSAAQICRTNGYVAQAPDVMHYQDFDVPIIDFSAAIPIPEIAPRGFDFTNVIAAAYLVINYVKAAFARGRQPLTGFMQMRFIKNSQAWLSPAYEPPGSRTHYCFIEIASAYPRSVAPRQERNRMVADYKELVKTVARQWIHEMGGRPHWAKYWQDAGLRMSAIYPAENRTCFNGVRRRLDPEQNFMNSFLYSLSLFDCRLQG